MAYEILTDAGEPLHATLDVSEGAVTLHSRGGKIGSPNERNRDYALALRLILSRALASNMRIKGIWVDSSRVRHLTNSERRVLEAGEVSESPEELFTVVSRRMQQVGRSPDARSTRGNSNKRLRIELISSGQSEIELTLKARKKLSAASNGRLSAQLLQRVTAEQIRQAVLDTIDYGPSEAYGPSRDYDLIADDGRRLPPKAVFGRAATQALGFQVLPRHFSAGEGQPCFKIFRDAGYDIVPKGQEMPEISIISSEDLSWTEGNIRLVSHLQRERARGVAAAKREAFREEHGRLFCERCGLDPVSHYIEGNILFMPAYLT